MGTAVLCCSEVYVTRVIVNLYPLVLKIMPRANGFVLVVFGVAVLNLVLAAIVINATTAAAIHASIDLHPDLTVVIGGDIFPFAVTFIQEERAANVKVRVLAVAARHGLFI